MDREEGEGETLMEEVAVLDFDMLCAAVALQTQGVKVERRTSKEKEDYLEEPGGVQRMWEGDVLGCFEDRRTAVEATCCACYRFGRNIERAGLGSCFLQVPFWARDTDCRISLLCEFLQIGKMTSDGTVYLSLLVLVLLCLIAFSIMKQHYFLYLSVASAVSFGLYAGYFRSRIRKHFNIKGRGSFIEDCVIHLICPCCTLCQESRTLEMNNVQVGIWHGRGDTICIGSYGKGRKELNALHKPSLVPTKNPESCSMECLSNGSRFHSWGVDVSPSGPLVLQNSPDEGPKT